MAGQRAVDSFLRQKARDRIILAIILARRRTVLSEGVAKEQR
jgi:hypothetical protein